MSQVDERVVRMQFDNAQFERNAQTSLKTLDGIKKASDFKGAGKGLSDLGAAVKGFSLNPISSATDVIGGKFSAMSVIAASALNRITNEAITAGTRIANALTIEPMKDGWQEYELKMNSVQTIMASTGADINEVNGYLEKLNTYSDKTIYSFADMTQNIGKFTNAGVGLKDAVAAIQGISNEAALSGANANEASRAMYNFAQALSAGHVKLIDWKSIENANMATKSFKEELIKTGVELGTLKKAEDGYITTTTNAKGKTSEAFTSTKGFNEALENQWMTTEVLTETLKKYSDETTGIGKKAFAAAQDIKTFSQLIDTLKEALGSGWAQSFEIVFGDMEEAKKLWTGVGKVLDDVIGQSAKRRNDLLKEWDKLGGRKDMIEGVKNAWEGLSNVGNVVKEAFRDIFPPLTGKRLADLTKKFKEFTKNLKLSDTQTDALKWTFKGIFGLAKQLGGAITGAGKTLQPLFHFIGEFANRLLNVTGAFGKWINGFSEFSDVTRVAKQSFGVLGGIVASAFDGIAGSFENFKSKVSGIGDVIKIVVEKVKGLISNLFKDGIDLPTIAKEGMIVAILASIQQAVEKFGGIFDAIKSPFEGLKKLFEDIGSPFKSAAKTLDSVRESLETWQNSLKVDILLKVAAAIGIIAGSIFLLSSIKPEKLKNALTAMTVMVGELIGSIKALAALDLKSFGSATFAILGFAISMGVLAGALKILSTIDAAGLAKGVIAMGALMFMLVKTMNAFGGVKFEQFSRFKKVVKSNPLEGIIPLAITIVILGEELQRLGRMDAEGIAKGLIAMGGVMTALYLFMKKAGDLPKDNPLKSGTLISLATSMVIFGAAMKIIASIKPEGAIQALASFAVFLGGYYAVVQAMSKLENGPSGGELIAMAASMLAMASAFAVFSTAMALYSMMDMESVAQGLISFSAMIAGVMLAMKAINDMDMQKINPASLLAFGAMLMTISGSFAIFSTAMLLFKAMDWQSAVAGLISFAGMLGGTVAALYALQSIKVDPVKMLALGGTMMLIASSMVLLGGAMILMSQAGIEGVAAGLITFGTVLAGLGIAANLLTSSAIAKMAALSGIFVVMAAGIAIFGAAMKMLASIPIEGAIAGLISLAGAFAIFGAAAVILTPVMPQMLALSGVLISMGAAVALVGVGIYSVAAGFMKLAQAMKEFATMSETETLNAVNNIQLASEGLIAIIPKLVSALAEGILELVGRLAESAGELVNSFLKMVDEVLKGLATKVPSFVESGIQFVVGLIQGIGQNVGELISAAVELVGNFATAIGENAPKLISSGIDMVLSLVQGIGQGLTSHQSDITAAISSLVEGVAGTAGAAIEGVLDGLGAGIGDAIANILEGALKDLPAMGTKLSEFATNASTFIEEMTGIDPQTMLGVKYLADAIATLVAINIVDNLPIVKFFKGDNSIADIGTQMKEFATNLSGLSGLLTPEDVSAVTLIASAISLIAQSASSIPETGGLAANIFGDNDISTFATKIKETATKLGELSDLPPVNENVVTSVKMTAKAISAMATASQEVPTTGGIKSFFTGEADIEGFAGDMKKAVTVMTDISNLEGIENVTGNALKKIQTTASAVKAMSQAASNIPETGGVKGFFTGSPQDLSDFADDMLAVGQAVTKMLNGGLGKFKNGQVQNINTVAQATRTLADAAKSVNEIDIDNGNSSKLVDFGNDMVNVAPKLVSFSNQCNKIKDKAASKVEKLVNTLKKVVNTAGDGGEFKTYGNALKNFSKSVVTACNKLASADIDSAKEKIQQLANIGKDLKPEGFDAFKEALIGGITKALSAGEKYKKKFKSLGESLGSQFAAGLKKKAKDAKTAGKALATAAAAGSNDGGAKASMKSAGMNVGQGFIEGLNSKIPTIRAKAAELGRIAAEATKAATEQHSPSRVFMRIGGFVGEGFVIGMQKTLPAIKKVSGNLGTESIKAAQQTLGIHSPSKEFEKIGKWAVKGFEKGFGNESKKAAKSVNKSFASITVSFAKSLHQNENHYVKLQSTLKSYEKTLTKATKNKKIADKILADPKASNALKKNAKQALSYANRMIKDTEATIKRLEKRMKNAKKLITDKKLMKTIEKMSGWLGTRIKKATKSAVKSDKKSSILSQEITRLKSDISEYKKLVAKTKKTLKDPKASKSDKRDAKSTLKDTERELKTLEKKLDSKQKQLAARMKKLTKPIATETLKQVKTIYGEYAKELNAIQKGLFKKLKPVTKASAAYIKAEIISDGYFTKMGKSFTKIYGSMMKASKKYRQNRINNLRDDKKDLADEKKSLQKRLDNDKKLTKKQREHIDKQIDAIEKKIRSKNKQISKEKSKLLLSTGAGVMEAFGDQLYKSSDSYKNTSKNLKEYAKNLKKLKAERDKLDKSDKNYQKNRAAKNKEIRALEKKIAKEAKNLAEGGKKALEKYRKELKKTYKEAVKLSSITIADDLFSGYTWEKASDDLEDVTIQLNYFSEAMNKAQTSSDKMTEAFDVMGVSVSTGIDLFTKFTKTGTAEVAALFEYAQTQLEAYEEFQNKLNEMKEMGFSQALIDELEEKGPDALNYIRGFVNMSADEVTKYNEVLAKKEAYENEKREKTYKKQEAQYSKWVSNLNTILSNELLDSNTKAKLAEKFASAGFSSTQAFASALASMSSSDMVKFAGYYVDSLKPLPDILQQAANTVSSVSTATDKKYSGFLEAYFGNKDEEAEFEKDLETLSKMVGETGADLVDQFRQAGKDSSWAFVKELLGTDKDQVMKLAEAVAGDVAAERAKQEAESHKNDPSFANGIANIEKENKEYRDWEKNLKRIQVTIDGIKNAAKTASKTDADVLNDRAKKLKYVFNVMKEGGYENAEAIKMLATAEVDEIDKMYDALKERSDINQKEKRDSIFKGQDDIVKRQKEFLSTLNTFTTLDNKQLFAGLNSKQAQKARVELMRQISEMGYEEGTSYMKQLLEGMDSDPEGFKEWGRDFYNATFTNPSAMAKAMTEAMGAVETGATAEWSKKYKPSVAKAVTSVATEAIEPISQDFFTVGQTAVNSLTNGMADGTTQANLSKTATTLGTTVLGGVSSSVSSENGKAMVDSFVDSGIISAASSKTKTVREAFEPIGRNMDNGVIDGIRNKQTKVSEVAAKMARSAYAAACKELGIKSPSTVFAEMGRYVDEGFAAGISNNANMVSDSTDFLADTAINNMRSAMAHIARVLNGEIEVDPTITPMLDLTEVRDGVRELNGLIEGQRIEASMSTDSQNQNGESNSGMTFIQNNYSPKALDRLEIYRQTNNQFARAKGLVNAR